MTETLDKLYLELSKITKARTEREKKAAAHIRWLIHSGELLETKSNDTEAIQYWRSREKLAEEFLTRNEL